VLQRASSNARAAIGVRSGGIMMRCPEFPDTGSSVSVGDMADDIARSPDGAHYRASADAVSSPMGDELALLDFRTNTYFTLNETGAAVWRLIETPQTIGSICSELAKIYEIEPEDCRGDVTVLISNLCDARLVEVLDGSGA
jgi:hypothetical protein